jgi:RNA polymerase-interacting CarD/CdnL/TRCF family regulator
LRLLTARADTSPEFRCQAWTTLALTALRAGDEDEALSAVRRAQSDSAYSHSPEIQTLSFLVLALAQSELRQSAASKSSLAAAKDFLRRVPETTTAEGVRAPNLDRLILEVIQQEAESRVR